MANDQPSHREVIEATEATEATMRPQTVPVNVYAAPEALVIVAPFPAVAPTDVTIELRPGKVRFWAGLRSAAPRDYLLHEWEYGGYEREVDVPAGYGSGIEASLANGQLAIRVLRGDPAEMRTIQPAGS